MDMNPYEEERLRRIERNREYMAQLGLASVSAPFRSPGTAVVLRGLCALLTVIWERLAACHSNKLVHLALASPDLTSSGHVLWSHNPSSKMVRTLHFEVFQQRVEKRDVTYSGRCVPYDQQSSAIKTTKSADTTWGTLKTSIDSTCPGFPAPN
eukprot:1178950-Prorocentrum_minimum.AAC.3